MSSLAQLLLLWHFSQRNVLRHRTQEDEPPRKMWVHPLVSQQPTKGHFSALYSDLRRHPVKFQAFMRISIHAYDKLLKVLRPELTYCHTNMRRCISPEERLLVTLRFLATGNTFCTSNSSLAPLRSLPLTIRPAKSSGID
ncbi:DDE superfamily endonuclease [Pristimantis euphronides]